MKRKTVLDALRFTLYVLVVFPVPCQLHQSAYAKARAAANDVGQFDARRERRITGRVRGHAGDVPVRPRIRGELGQENGTGADAAKAATEVLHIGVVTANLVAVLVVQRQAPQFLVGVVAGDLDLAREVVVVAEKAGGDVLAQRDDARACQRRQIDHGLRLEVGRVA